MNVTIKFGHVNPKPGFISAWDAARNYYGHASFDAMPHSEQVKAVRQYVSR